MENVLIPGTVDEMMKVDFWIDRLKNGSRIIMSASETCAFNERIIEAVDEVNDLKKHKKSLDRQELINCIRKYRIPQNVMYDINGRKVSCEFYDEIIDNTNIGGIKDVNPVRYGIAVKNGSFRAFPTDRGIYKTEDDKEFDRFQETGCQAIEPVLILHESRDGEWYFARMYNYTGWIRKTYIALAQNADEVFNYLDTENFIVVTGNKVRAHYNPYDMDVSEIEFHMGTRIPAVSDSVLQDVGNQSVLGNYILKLPVRDKSGKLGFKYALIARNEYISEGYLQYTGCNIINQVFKLQGDRYGWGDSFNGRDCSSTVMYVYKTFGIYLPRNCGEQEKVPGRRHTFKTGASAKDRCRVFDDVKPGSPIYMEGHTMMYLGQVKGIPYIIHNFHKYGKMEEGKLIQVPVNEVAVTSALLLTASGTPFIERFTSVVEIPL